MTVDIAKLRELLSASTRPPPWKFSIRYVDDIYADDGSAVIETDCGVYPPKKPEAALIVALRNAAPELLDELERLRRLEAAVLEMDDQEELPIAEPVYAAYHGAIDEARAAKELSSG